MGVSGVLGGRVPLLLFVLFAGAGDWASEASHRVFPEYQDHPAARVGVRHRTGFHFRPPMHWINGEPPPPPPPSDEKSGSGKQSVLTLCRPLHLWTIGVLAAEGFGNDRAFPLLALKIQSFAEIRSAYFLEF